MIQRIVALGINLNETMPGTRAAKPHTAFAQLETKTQILLDWRPSWLAGHETVRGHGREPTIPASEAAGCHGAPTLVTPNQLIHDN